jgi:hypothetical protein
MATPIDLLDPPAVMSYGGLVDAATAEGREDDEPVWADAFAATVVHAGEPQAAPVSERDRRPVRHLAHITGRRGAYSPSR